MILIIKNVQHVGTCVNATNNQNNKTQTKLSTKTTQTPMTTKNMVEGVWAEYIGQFLYQLDPETKKK